MGGFPAQQPARLDHAKLEQGARGELRVGLEEISCLPFDDSQHSSSGRDSRRECVQGRGSRAWRPRATLQSAAVHRLYQLDKPGLLKVMVRSECSCHVLLSHHNKTDAISQAPFSVRTLAVKRPAAYKQVWIGRGDVQDGSLS